MEIYREKAKKILYEDYGDNERKLHSISFKTLNELRIKLGISPEEASSIEAEILQTCRDYEAKAQKYKQILVNMFRDGDTLDNKVRKKLKHFQDASELENKTVALVYVNLGNELSREGKPNKAVNLFKEAILINRYNPAAHMSLGILLYKKGKQKEAVKRLTIARDLFKEQGMTQEAEGIDEFLSQERLSDNVLEKFVKWLSFYRK
ncbi:MAG: hypothetical protein QNJ54_33055 [Prochloraceae cyanobacterium]|nr:hypothetical protein [Prochloraceae cyanobacterium]